MLDAAMDNNMANPFSITGHTEWVSLAVTPAKACS